MWKRNFWRGATFGCTPGKAMRINVSPPQPSKDIAMLVYWVCVPFHGYDFICWVGVDIILSVRRRALLLSTKFGHQGFQLVLKWSEKFAPESILSSSTSARRLETGRGRATSQTRNRQSGSQALLLLLKAHLPVEGCSPGCRTASSAP